MISSFKYNIRTFNMNFKKKNVYCNYKILINYHQRNDVNLHFVPEECYFNLRGCKDVRIYNTNRHSRPDGFFFFLVLLNRFLVTQVVPELEAHPRFWWAVGEPTIDLVTIYSNVTVL